jgi:hypothetical protein
MPSRIGRAEVKLQIDVSAGDPVTPAPSRREYPTLRAELPAPVILGYQVQTVLAEKVCTAVELGQANTRVRDYADVWTLTGRDLGMTAEDMLAALEATARHRLAPLWPLRGVIGPFAAERAVAYERYSVRLGPDATDLPNDFTDLVDGVLAFTDSVLDGSAPPRSRWHAGTRTWSD